MHMYLISTIDLFINRRYYSLYNLKGIVHFRRVLFSKVRYKMKLEMSVVWSWNSRRVLFYNLINRLLWLYVVASARWVRSPTLDGKVTVEYYISDRTHKPNALRFWDEIWDVVSKFTCVVALDSNELPSRPNSWKSISLYPKIDVEYWPFLENASSQILIIVHSFIYLFFHSVDSMIWTFASFCFLDPST